MAINFVRERGRILMCNYGMARVPPEMEKTRRCVVVSPRSYNGRHGQKPGRCLVVPFSATDPARHKTPADVVFNGNTYECLTVETWAICAAAMSVSHDRLDRVWVKQPWTGPLWQKSGPSSEILHSADMARIEVGLRHATGSV
jgi:uncharacterized protein YifN (PemK superfamily)